MDKLVAFLWGWRWDRNCLTCRRPQALTLGGRQRDTPTPQIFVSPSKCQGALTLGLCTSLPLVLPYSSSKCQVKYHFLKNVFPNLTPCQNPVLLSKLSLHPLLTSLQTQGTCLSLLADHLFTSILPQKPWLMVYNDFHNERMVLREQYMWEKVEVGE